MSTSFFVFWIKFDFKNRNKILKIISDSVYFAFLIHIILLDFIRKISDEVVFKTVLTVILSIVAGILYNLCKKYFLFNGEKIKKELMIVINF